MRYGPCGYGVVPHEELGLGWLEVEDVSAWASRRFTRDNALLWMTTEPPADLELMLPAGERLPLPEAQTIPA